MLGSVDTARRSFGCGGWRRRRASPSASPSAASPSSPGGRAQKKRSGTTLPMPGRKPASRLWSRKASASPTAACSSLPDGQQRGQRGRQRVAGADEGGVEALELLAGERALRRGQHVVDELLGALGRQHDAGDQHEARAVLAGGHRQLARRGRALAVPVGQQEVGQRLVVADQHLGGRQDQLAKRVEVGAAARPRRASPGWACRPPAARRGSRDRISATALTPSAEPRKPTFQAGDA